MRIYLIILFSVTLIDYIFPQCNCEALPPPESGEIIVYASTTAEVQEAIDNANGKTTIYLNSGTYLVNSSVFINVHKPDITIRSTSGNRNDVVIQGEGMAAVGGVGHGIFVNADRVTVADLTVRDIQNHAFFVNPGADSCLFHNVRGLDTGEQIFKASGYSTLQPKNYGIVECSTFEYTTTLDDGDDGYYTQGIDLLNCHHWIIRDNVVRNIKHNPSLTSTLAGPAILCWQQSSNTIVERNVIIACDFGISFGNAAQVNISHTGGIIRNNFIIGYEHSDFGIGLIYAPDAKVINNTIYSPGSWPYSIEARFTETNNCMIMNNLADEDIWDNRDGASCMLTTNNTSATPAYFVNIGRGDLHLKPDALSIINAGTVTTDRFMDIDCADIISPPDLGADEYDSTYAVTDISEHTENVKIAVYPIPSKGIIKIEGEGIKRVVIFNAKGQLCQTLYQDWEKVNAIDLHNEASGLYFINVITEKGIFVRKVIKD